MPSPHPHLLGIDGMSPDEFGGILDEAEPWVAFNRQARRCDGRLAGLTQINAFFENSTRTLFSFEIAGKRLGAQVSSFHVASSSVQKGETLVDTALTLNAMRPDVIVVRHAAEGAAAEVAAVADCPVINAGDGRGEHPTQALLDALTIRRRFGRIAGLTIAICGDVRHSRVAGSNLIALPLQGARLRLVGPPSLLPERVPEGIATFTDFDAGLEGADVVMMLRVQRERIDDAALAADPILAQAGSYATGYKLTRKRLARAAPHAIVMHPGPMNRGVEIDSDVADDPERSVIREQVELGVAIRMAVLDRVTRDRRDR